MSTLKPITPDEVKRLSIEYFESVKTLSQKKLGRVVNPKLSFDFNKKNKLGLANYVENTIYINIDILKYNPEQIKDTVIHEYCHILDKHVYNKFGHGKTWKKLMVNLGGNPAAKVDDINSDPIVKESDKKTYYAYICGCNDREHYFTPTQHKKILKESLIYQCRICKKSIKYKRLVTR